MGRKIPFAICQETFQGWNYESICKFVSGAGYDGLELAPYMFAEDIRSVPANERQEIAKIAQDLGLTVTGLHWLLVKPAGMYINHTDATVRRHTTDYLKSLVDFCKDVGGTIMTLGSPKQRMVMPGLTYNEARRLAVEVFSEVGAHAAQQGVILCLEALPVTDTDFMTTAGEAREVAHEVNSSGVAIMLDVKSMCSEAPKSIPDIIKASKTEFKHFHANDSNLKGPGFGDVDFVPIFEALLEVAYDGFVSVEAFNFEPSPETVALRSLKYMSCCASMAGV